ncbi:AMP-dependent synthetase/ligase [Stackebrandtia nassauensis]|uniref:Acyl-CoA synthetase n=1 Tax=Stackebrandtia nassauensis (strain DSM 44728 / CIP 108903 / NRRL B-16338 / NBRC 102104 / LLR-40K-21) TaxID=446470 RepID=D3Q8R8_STANL|nr:long-chain fatty acid--CoA ligase [Stackebrandtia nassauensis]ADD44510.1 AMP-dependent synthetase and ligase [Stackebrandtia nassauensis DSM 44728]
MREFSVPPVFDNADDHTTTTDLWAHADNYPDHPLFAVPEGGGWRDVTVAEFHAQVATVARGLAEAGVGPGDRVGLLSKTRYEWTLCDYAIWAAGAVTVPIYDSSSAEQVKWVLSDSGAVACIAETTEHAATVASVRDDIPALANVWTIDEGGLDTLTESGKGSEIDIDARRSAVKADDLATIVYTSGTTGRPKGCVLTHRNLVSDICNILPELQSMFSHDSTTLMFLPLAHVLARIIQIGCVQSRVKVGHISDYKVLVENLATYRPTFLVAVPRVFEKVYNGAEQKATDGGKDKIFHAAERTAIEYSKALDTGGPGLGLRIKHAIFDKLVYSKLRTVVGGKCDRAISGGAPLGERLAHFFRGVGITIYEGYGLTETSPVVSLNIDKAHRIGSVGKPIPSTSIKIADDKELLVKGPQVFGGYWNNDTATAESFVDGWYKTGDQAEIDEDGYLKITGRSKEIIVTAAGKNVAPAPLEDVIRAHPLVGQCLVLGDGKPFVSALVALDPEALPGWLERAGKPADTTFEQLVDDPDAIAAVQEAVDSANQTVSKAESIKTFTLLPAPLSEESGEVTPKQSVKRNVVLEKYAEAYEAMYTRQKTRK